jgi:hypothetical protein
MALAQNLDSRHLGHPLVGQNHLDGRAGAEEVERLGSVLESDDPVVHPQQVVDRAQHVAFVVNHNHGRSLAVCRRLIIVTAGGGRFRTGSGCEVRHRGRTCLLSFARIDNRGCRQRDKITLAVVKKRIQRYLDSLRLSESSAIASLPSRESGREGRNRLMSVTSFPRSL